MGSEMCIRDSKSTTLMITHASERMHRSHLPLHVWLRPMILRLASLLAVWASQACASMALHALGAQVRWCGGRRIDRVGGALAHVARIPPASVVAMRRRGRAAVALREWGAPPRVRRQRACRR